MLKFNCFYINLCPLAWTLGHWFGNGKLFYSFTLMIKFEICIHLLDTCPIIHIGRRVLLCETN